MINFLILVLLTDRGFQIRGSSFETYAFVLIKSDRIWCMAQQVLEDLISMALNLSGHMQREGFLNLTVCLRPALTSTSKSVQVQLQRPEHQWYTLKNAPG
jgi:hypothetical protein